MLGVRPVGRKWVAQVSGGPQMARKTVYLGIYEDPISAAMARDKYVVEHGLDVALNFPHIREVMREEVMTQAAD